MKVYVVGIGPGGRNEMTLRAINALKQSDTIVGYTKYIELLGDLIEGKSIISTEMTKEVDRCISAFEAASLGKTVSIVSSGDSGVYGMASLIYQLWENYKNVEIEVIPGVTAALSSSAILGSPLTNDFAVISLSDLLTPMDIIEKRLTYASLGDFVICLYNPSSAKRKDHLKKACAILMKHRQPQTLCGWVKNAGREFEETKICSLAELSNENVDMFTTVIIGNSQTIAINGKLVTTRGYKICAK